ncbi:hypothetical protein [Zoogloea sp.]|uniref:hypothetical protein n=1 Tax=Zoogloea sp. TaxID=49181 RepID=UPI001415EC19|nr:MAG: hypothetical protein F9K15_24265 [Zoogloea sp.]
MKYIYLLSLSLLFIGCPTPPNNDDDNGGGNGEAPKRDYVWSIDTMVYNVPEAPPDQVYMYCIWGSSPRDVWAVGQSDVGAGRLWHYNGVQWTPRIDRPRNGFDGDKGYIVYPFAVTGFDSANVFIACDRFYIDDEYGDSAMVLKWNGFVWSEVPWINGRRANGGLGEILPQGKTKLWVAGAAGSVARYENGIMIEELPFTNFRLGQYFIAPLENGEVYVNALKDSSNNNVPQGTITKLYYRSLNGVWSLIEDKFISGADYDDNGFGRGVLSIGNKLFTTNSGIWERMGNSWIKRLTMQRFGGNCFIAENNMWIYYNQQIWHYNGKDWKEVIIPQLQNYPSGFLYGRGWSDNKEIFLSLHYNGKTYIVHGR